MRKVVIIGVGMTKFGKFLDTTLEELGRTAVWNAINYANVDPKQIQCAYVANSVHGMISGKSGVIGQGILARSGIGGIPVVNVENACSGGSTALRGAYLEVASGSCDIALAVGAEKMYCADLAKAILSMTSNSPYDGMGYQFSGDYAMRLRRYMREFGVTREHVAKVVVKNSYNGSLNPNAQHRRPLTVEEILNSRLVAEPLTLYMCCSIGDGAAAAVVTTEGIARRHTSKPLVEIASCSLRSGQYTGWTDPDNENAAIAAKEAYEKAGLGPEDVDVAEVHDAMAPAELWLYEQLGFCKKGESARLIDEGRTKINGDIPVNPSGGLAAKGHPVSATGLAQIAEIVWQLKGEAGERQISGNPKVGLTENAGGYTEFDDNGAASVIILKR